MSREQTAGAATPTEELRDRIMNPNRAKNEQEYWAARRIEELEAALAPTVSGGEGWEELERKIDSTIEAAYADGRNGDDAPLEKRKASLRALIAVARGGFSALQASPSVPTEGHGAAVVALREALESVLPLAFSGASSGLDAETWDADQKILEEAQAVLLQTENRKLGGYEAQPSEPNTLPTVQAETAVVGDEIFGVSGAADEVEAFAVALFAHRCPGIRMTDEDLHYYRAAAKIGLEAATADLEAVSTGEQPGMSEANET